MSDLLPCPWCNGPAAEYRPNDVACLKPACPGQKTRHMSREEWNTRAALSPLPSATEGWRDMGSALRDGTPIDLWHRVYGRRTNMYWGKPEHCCGEAGIHCDSEWHSEPQGWVWADFNEADSDEEGFTHWMPQPLPPPPVSAEGGE